jgi:oligopeptide/dipeptide ABC transporter ATP-binding protein
MIPILKGEGLSKYFTGRSGLIKRTIVKAVEDVDLTLFPKEIVSVVGESGSGKTTLGKILAGIYPPDKGRIYFEGKEVTEVYRSGKRKEIAKMVQYVFQDPFSSLPPHKRVGKVLEDVLRLHGLARDVKLKREVKRVLEMVGLTPADEVASKLPHELSGGQRQRASIARALAVNPKVIIADEPVSMLDMSIRASVLELMKKLREEVGISLIYITHDLTTARIVSDRILVMYRGKVVEVGETERVIGNPLHPYTQLLVNSLPEIAKGGTGIEREEGEVLRTDPHTDKFCVFYHRCNFAKDICSKAEPVLSQIEQGHSVACFLYSAESK